MRNPKLLAYVLAAAGALSLLDILIGGGLLLAAEGGGHHAGPDLGGNLPLWSIVPFAGLLLSIAVFPLVAPHFWHHHFPKISAAWALLFAIPFLIAYGGAALYEILHIYLADYIPFIILLWGLYTASGGILVRGKLKGTPLVNTTFLLIGTLIASWVGTTGAAMLLIRPLIRSNRDRKSKVHIVVFFIFLVANIGGSLTPLGDPPLFLGFLHGVSFFWTMKLLPMMSFVAVILLVLFFVIDTILYRREQAGRTQARDEAGEKGKISIVGLYNLIFLMGIMGSVLMSGMLHLGEVNIGGVHVGIQNIMRDVLIVAMGLLSLHFTPNALRRENEFTWFPILEVAYLFAGIFMTIIPALMILRAGEHGALAFLVETVKEPRHYFWVTGILSSFLDNAPTYLTFFNSALGQLMPGVPEAVGVPELMTTYKTYLLAISCGAVFMGANTYIGNAPNFMVRSIAEESGVSMPSFFGFMLYSGGILIPLFFVVTLIFF
ncbi:MAG: sodium:proton antiporter [Candidatus Glassbacteria bacterium]|nr:sodium:proton antiporter [Candidatus Glassbacteria bacterium]